MSEHELRQEIAALREQYEIESAASRSAFVVLVRYLAEGQQLHIDELCTDLDAMCIARPEEQWQRSLMALAEVLRGVDGRLPGGPG
ncbi:hypothetical protein [Pseudomonas knackmussii]|uniref:hypothetical protein n=1 Tax=Pseudomonas knackmussii TaxID=65741 RepID=UPI003F49FC5A